MTTTLSFLPRRVLVSCVVALPLLAGMVLPAQAQSEASLALSALPTASVVSTAAAGSTVAASAAGAVIALPAALSVSGAVLTVVAVDASVRGTVLVLERASDGARASIEITRSAGRSASQSVGTVVSCTVIASGVILSAAGEVLAFIPNALGRALLHNEPL